MDDAPRGRGGLLCCSIPVPANGPARGWEGGGPRRLAVPRGAFVVGGAPPPATAGLVWHGGVKTPTQRGGGGCRGGGLAPAARSWECSAGWG